MGEQKQWILQEINESFLQNNYRECIQCIMKEEFLLLKDSLEP